jgi:DNA-binding CsgD family transcriptional regulator
MAGGRSNRENAARLVIAEGTVEVHVKHILSKLGFRSRSHMVAWIAQRSPKCLVMSSRKLARPSAT